MNGRVLGIPLSPLESLNTVGREIARNMVDLAGNRIRRTNATVAADYDRGDWQRVLNDRRWERCPTLYDYVVPADDTLRVARVEGRLVRISTRNYYAYRLAVLQSILTEMAGDADELLELGCGFGMNLFSLVLANRWPTLRGFDISHNGVRAAREAAAHFGVMNVQVGEIDLTNGDHPAFTTLAGKTCFTYLCLEQLKYATETVIRNLLKAGVRRVVHIESATELLRLWRPADLASYLYIKRMDYQDNILRSLRALERGKALRIVEVRRLHYSPTRRYDPLLVCWEAYDQE